MQQDSNDIMSNRVKLLIKYLVPTVLTQLSIFLFTIVDGIFVGRGVGTDALGAVNIVFPYMMFFFALTMLTSIGAFTIAAIRIGRGEDTGANEVFMHSIILTAIISAILSLSAIIFPTELSRLMGANETYIYMAKDYLFWYGVFMVPCGVYTNLSGFVRNDGRPSLVTVSVVITTALNVFGDWLLIFPMGMGLKGAAIATGVSQTIGCLIVLSHFILKKGRFTFHRFNINWHLTGHMIVRGLPECVAQFCVPVTTIITNIIMVSRLGVAAENSYSIICYVASFSIAIFYGVAEGLQPLFGNCYGEDNEKDLKYYKRIGLIIGGVGSAIITLIIILLTEPICMLYGADPETTAVTMNAMPIYAWGFVIQSFNVIISAYLYSTTRTKHALIINILRSFVVNSIITLLLPLIFGADIIWFTFPIYEAIVMVIAFALMIKADKKGIIDVNRE